MNKEDKEDIIETLDFDNDTSLEDDTVEMLDFEADKKVSNEIDEMLDFIDLTDQKKESEKQNKEELDDLLKSVNDDKQNKVEITASEKKLDEYVPSIKDFNIKNAKTRKIVKKVMLYVIIVMLIGFEFFINKTGDVLNDLIVYASDNDPIRIVQNDKYGYIDYTGDKIVNPKYSYAEEFVSGYAIVRDASNLPLIIDKGGKVAVNTGTYFSLYRADTDIIASKVTDDGLKYGILNSSLKEKTKFNYDLISYQDGCYSFVNGNTVGLINLDGKEIFTYKLTDSDDKVIDVKTSSVNGNYTKYAVVTVNKTSQIVNLDDGTSVYSPTLNEIVPEENNVFYEVINDDARRYIYVENNEVILEVESYNSLIMPSIEAGVLRAINSNYEYEYISTKTKEQLSDNITEDNSFYGDDIFMYYTYNSRRRKNDIALVKNGEVYKTIEADFEIEKEFHNGFAIVKFSDGKYGYLNEDGNLLNDVHYDEAGQFDSYGEAIAKTSSGYGVINKDNKTIIDFENEEIKMASSLVKQKTASNRNNVFYAVKKDSLFVLYKDNGKKVDNLHYTDIVFDDVYPVVKVATDAKDVLLTTEDLNEIPLTSFNNEYEAHDNYIIVKNEYYNYNGKLIYVDNNKES
ncbi:MAG TPA: WG repeat-containing protein [Candidatus Aphodocola excrementigallinarum]|uniref:WG repeat-containing protein n=1 Tax=Candidatus Aphodocola excrementigallinarum TaxID=2840670 RepID=A0A9D1IP86_9FIRM|nr:WG repeat-containing protein [Candidatus Aphodocola excrementigallinarum]